MKKLKAEEDKINKKDAKEEAKKAKEADTKPAGDDEAAKAEKKADEEAHMPL